MKKFKEYIKEETDIEGKLAEFFKNNPNPSDNKVHQFAEDNGIDKHKLEEIIYSILTKFYN